MIDNSKFMCTEILSKNPECEVSVCKRLSTDKIFVLKQFLYKNNIQDFVNLNEIDIYKKISEDGSYDKMGIPTIYEIGKNYISMEYLKFDLYDYWCLRDFSLHISEIKNIAIQIFSAVNYLHQKGIVHRDIKLENLLYHCGKVKICDFDRSITKENLVYEGYKLTGTIGYFAPEMYNQYYDEKIDVWSTGICIYELLVGKSPFFDIQSENDNEKIKVEMEKKYQEVKKNKKFSCFQSLLEYNFEKRPSFEYLIAKFSMKKL